VYCNGA
jgi:ribonuclease HI